MIFRKSSPDDLKRASLHNMSKELHSAAPMLFRILNGCATPSGSYTRKRQQQSDCQPATSSSIVVAISLLLKERCVHMSTIPYIIGLLLWQGNASNKVGIIIID